MRIEKTCVIDAPREEVWEVVSNPANTKELLHNVPVFEHEGGPKEGKGARYSLRMHVGSADVGGLVEIVEYHEPGDLAWTSVTGIDQRVRWRLRETPGGGTKVTLRISYVAPGGILATIADRLSSSMGSDNIQKSLENLRERFGGRDGLRENGLGLAGRVAYHVGTVRVLRESGIVRPIRPDRLLHIATTLVRWGRSPAAGFIALAAQYPDEPAIIDELGTLSFKDVDIRTNALAHAFQDHGIKEGDGVALMMRNHRGFIESVVALSKIGADALLLNTAFAAPQLTEVVKREKPIAIIYDEEFTELLEDAGKRRKRFVGWHDSEQTEDPNLDDLMDEGDPACPVPAERESRITILTSGTTGTPKGASRGNPESIDPAAALLSRIPLHARQTAHIAAPLFHSWGLAHFTLGMLLGTTYVLRRKFDPEQCLAEVSRHQCDSLAVVPVMMSRILELPEETRRKYDVSCLKVAAASGSALPGDLANKWMDEFGENLYNLYGSTEVAWASIASPEDLRAAPGTAGKPPRGTVLRIYDENGVQLPAGETGRIFVGNEMLFEGYTGGGSKDVIDGLMATGDVGRIDQSGRLFVEGRDDVMIVSGGENVFPKEVEDVISRMPGVADVAAIGVEDEQFGQRLKAFVVSEGSKKPSEDAVKKHVKSNLARYKVPREVEFIDELPRNATGKVLKRELEEREEEKGEKAGKK